MPLSFLLKRQGCVGDRIGELEIKGSPDSGDPKEEAAAGSVLGAEDVVEGAKRFQDRIVPAVRMLGMVVAINKNKWFEGSTF